MNEIYINGIGISNEESIDKYASTSKMRRAPRYSKMAVAAAKVAQLDANLPSDIDKNRIGTIFASGFGSLDSSLEFSSSVELGRPDLVSPTLFSYSVANSCVGQICIINGFKGFSTMLTAGDPLEYSAMLLKNNKVDFILCGAIEEFNEELNSAIKSRGLLNENYIESAIVMILSTQKSSNSYCKVSKFNSTSLENCPYIHKVDVDSSKKSLINVLKTYNDVDAIFIQTNGSYFDEIEHSAINEVFGDIKIIPRYGEALGSGYLLNVVQSAKLLHTGDFNSILVTNVDPHGNYLTVKLIRSK